MEEEEEEEVVEVVEQEDNCMRRYGILRCGKHVVSIGELVPTTSIIVL